METTVYTIGGKEVSKEEFDAYWAAYIEEREEEEFWTGGR